jgi:hypothetical protein
VTVLLSNTYCNDEEIGGGGESAIDVSVDPVKTKKPLTTPVNGSQDRDNGTVIELFIVGVRGWEAPCGEVWITELPNSIDVAFGDYCRVFRWVLVYQVLQQKNLTENTSRAIIPSMRNSPKNTEPGNTAETVRRRIEASGERVWRLADFDGMPFMAVAQALSRLSRQGMIQRLGKGLYYRPRQTAFGQSKPNTAQIRSLPLRRRGVFPAGIAAANLLGFTTQNAAKVELATDGLSLPRLIVGKEAVIHTRRPESWRALSETDAALLDFLRNRGMASELSPDGTVSRLLDHFREPGRFERLLDIASSEPPRVRAMLGAIGEQLAQPESKLSALRKSLNPLSRFDFGSLAVLEHARAWQAKERKARETI